MLTLNIAAESPMELEANIIELAKALMGRQFDKSVQQLTEELRAKLAENGMDLRVVSKKAEDKETAVQQEAVAGTDEPKDEPEVVTAKKKRGGQPRVSKEEAAEALGEETPAGRKARCVAKLQDLFANGKKAEVLKILADYGGGAKTFAAVDEAKFEPISDALEAL